jgi:ABC-type Na+ efflux pump permease subunit
MKKIFRIASREFVATVFTKGFLIGLLIMPLLIALFAILGPWLFNPRNFQVEGEVAIVDPTGKVIPELRQTLDAKGIAARRSGFLDQVPEGVRDVVEGQEASRAMEAAIGQVPDFRLIERPADTDIQAEKKWLIAEKDGPRRLALVVIHSDAVVPKEGNRTYGAYDLYVPAKMDELASREIRASIREAIINARILARNLDRRTFNAIARVADVQSVTVTPDEEKATVGGFNVLVPAVFGMLLFMGVMTGSGELLNSTVEEKSSRVVEVLLSAVSPMELMAGKLFGKMAAAMIGLGLYIGMGLVTLTSFAMLGLLNPWLILYLIIFFVITYFIIGSLMMAIGAAVNDMREAQSLMMPIIMLLVIPWVLWFPISRDPNSALSVALSFTPIMNSFAMMLRMASNTPPPAWQIWASVGIGVASVYATLWFTAKVFRIGLLMYGKPPNLRTLIRWARSA